jgi:hypothetical protein
MPPKRSNERWLPRRPQLLLQLNSKRPSQQRARRLSLDGFFEITACCYVRHGTRQLRKCP